MAALDMITVGNGNYQYGYIIDALTDESILTARKMFVDAVSKGIILGSNFDGSVWIWSSEQNHIRLDFSIDPDAYISFGNAVNATIEQIALAFRLVVISSFGYSIKTIQAICHNIRSIINKQVLPQDDIGDAVLGFLELLPYDTSKKSHWIDALYDSAIEKSTGKGAQRNLAEYQSYFKFDYFLQDFWAKATVNEKLLYFPVFFWWRVTCTLPLRATEVTLTPRECLRANNGQYFLRVRRTKLKGTMKGATYTIDDDYEICEYQIPESIAMEIQSYILATAATYDSDIDTLFSKSAQFLYGGILQENNRRYTYCNLRQCLNSFVKNVIISKYHLRPITVTDQIIKDDQIILPQLGDTRHIAMMSLVFSGASPSICKELAGHQSISISAHYFSNIRSFLDALALVPYSPSFCVPSNYPAQIKKQYPVTGGYCQNNGVAIGDFSACANAIDAYGNIGVCDCCPYLLRRNGQILATNSNKYSGELERVCVLLRQSIDRLFQDCNNEQTLSCALEQLRANALQYLQSMRIEQVYKNESRYIT